MTDILNITDEESERISRRIEYFLEFTRDVLDDPSILDHIPDGSNVKAIPKELRDADQRYDIETPRMLAIVTPPNSGEDEQETNAVERAKSG